MIEGKRIVLGVSGGIAAYKAVELCRRLVDAGAHVIPVLTEGSLHFVGRTTFDALGSERAWTSLWDEAHPIPHTHLGQTADLVLVAPATARVLGLYAAGISDDLLLNVLIATRAPVVVCPAMHTEMWEHPAVQDNLRLLRARGVHVVEPGVGRLAGGDVGAGRLAEPEDILAAVEAVLSASSDAPTADLAGVRTIVTAGGTREPIDPVRFIGNRSSGKQGPCRGRGGSGARGQGHARHHDHAGSIAGDRRRPRRHRSRDGARRPEPGRRRRADRHGRRRGRLPTRARGRQQDQEGRRSPRRRARAHGRHPGCARRSATARADHRGVRGRDQRPPGQRGREAGAQGHRPHRGERCICTRRRLRARHQRRGHPRQLRRRPRGPAHRQAGHRPCHPRCSIDDKEQS